MTMRYRTPETRDVALTGPDNLQQFIKSLGAGSFQPDAYRRRTVGAFGELEGGDPRVRYQLPETFSAEALSMLPPEQLDRLYRLADQRYDVLEQTMPDTRGGVIGQNDDGQDIYGTDPNRDAALQAVQQLQGAIKTAQGQVSQARLRNENQLLGGIAELGYQFAPGSLGDASVREEIWNARDYLPQFLRTAAKERRFIGGPGDAFRQDGFSWRPPGSTDWNGVEDDPSMAPPPETEEGQTYRLPQAMPYNPADPLSEAAYYGGDFPNEIGPMRRGPNEPRYRDFDIAPNRDVMQNYSPPVYPDDRIVRDAGQTAYNDLRPGFYNAGSITGPAQPPVFQPQRPVFDGGPAQRFQAPRPLGGGMELRPGVRVRNPFEESVRRLGPRPSRGMFS